MRILCYIVLIYILQPNFPKLSAEPVPIIFDTDMGSDCDDVGALALLHHYVQLGKAEIVACIYSSGAVPYGASVIQAINIYYGRGDIPIGANHDPEVGDPVDKMQSGKFAKDQIAYGHSLLHSKEVDNQTMINRKILAEAEDNSVIYLTVGHTRGLYDLLTSEPDTISALNGMKLVQQKVKSWVALGALGADNTEGHFAKDWNFFFNKTAPYTAFLVEHFPKPAYFVDAGTKVMTGKSLIPTPPCNIVRTAYRDWLWNVEKKTLEDQRPSWDLAAVYFAVEGLGDFLEYAAPGHLEFDAEMGSRWNTGIAQSNHYYVKQKEDTDQGFADYLNKRIVK